MSAKTQQSAETISECGPINSQELLSFYSALELVVQSQNISRDAILEYIEAKFCVDDVSQVLKQDFYSLMEYVIDLRFEVLRSKR